MSIDTTPTRPPTQSRCGDNCTNVSAFKSEAIVGLLQHGVLRQLSHPHRTGEYQRCVRHASGWAIGTRAGEELRSSPTPCASVMDRFHSPAVVTQAFDGGSQIARPFRHTGRCSGLNGVLRDVWIGCRREYDDFRFRLHLRDLTTRLQPVEVGHVAATPTRSRRALGRPRSASR
jgi:hypothetical protein